MKTLAALALVLCATLASATPLSDLANSMKAGEWKELATNNISVLADNGASGTLIIYTDELVWYPDSQQIFAVVSDHYGSGQQFINYNEKTNSWSRLARASWFTSGTMHGYDHQAIDVKRGIFYHQPACCAPKVKKYDLAAKTWSEVGDALDKYESYMGFEYFPEIGGLVRANNYDGGARGTLKFLADGGAAWTTLASGLTMGSIHIFSEYNPIFKVVIFGGGQNDTHIYKVDSTKRVVALNAAPVGLGIQEAVFTVDPVSGDYLVFAGRDNPKFYVYRVQSDTWVLQTGTVPIYHADAGWAVLGIAATPIPEYGVNFFVSTTYSQRKVWLYRHSGTAANGKNRAFPEKPDAQALKGAPVRVYDLQGKLMADLPGAWDGAGLAGFDSRNLPSGLYFMKIRSGARQITRKLLVQR